MPLPRRVRPSTSTVSYATIRWDFDDSDSSTKEKAAKTQGPSKQDLYQKKYGDAEGKKAAEEPDVDFSSLNK